MATVRREIAMERWEKEELRPQLATVRREIAMEKGEKEELREQLATVRREPWRRGRRRS